MNKITQSLKAQLVTLFMLCVSLTSFAEVVEINNVFYDLQTWWSYGYTDANGNWTSGQSYERAAIVTYDHSIDPGSMNIIETYQGDIVIPDKVTKDGVDYPVVSVGYDAFMRNRSLTSVQLPSSVVYINYNAFYECSMLTSVTMPGIESFSSDDGSIFSGTKITSLVLPKTLKNISSSVFRSLDYLTSITVEEGNASYKSVDGVLYDKNMTKIVGFPAKRGGTYTVPSTITVIKSNTFPCGMVLDELIIPATVTKIEDNAFCSPQVKKLTINNSKKELYFGKGDYGFDGFNDENNNYHYYSSVFTTLEELYLGRNLKCPDYCSPFAGSSNLNKVTIGSYVTSMIKYAFHGCYVIDYVNYNGTITGWCNITFEGPDATPFGKSMAAMYGGSAILYLKGSPLHSQVNIPSGATKIGAYAFYGMDGVSSVVVPSTVTTIEPYAFNSSSITTVYLNTSSVIGLADANSFFGETAIILEDYNVMAAYKKDPVWATLSDNLHTEAFLSTTVDLTAMTNSPALLPALNALEKVNDEYRIAGLTNLKIRGTMNGWDILMIRTKMPKLHTLDLSEATILDNDGGQEYYTGYHTTANTISPYCFYQMESLRKVMLPQKITSIGEYAFAECPNLQEVLYIPKTCTEICPNAFRQSGLRSIEINKGVKTIGYSAFESCYSLREVTFVKGLETIEYNAFNECRALEKLVFPTTLKQIGSNAFYNCSSLAEIDFAEGLTDIDYGAFSYCWRLKDLHLPTSLKYINENAFRHCSGLSQVHLPSKLKQIGDYAFKDCGLKSVYAYTLIPVQINQNTFDYKGVDLFAPDNSFYTYYMNTQWAQFPNVYEFPALYTNWYTGRDTDIEINVKVPIKSADENNPADGEMEPGSGMVFVGDGEQLVKKLIMNWGHGDNYPSLIENGNLSVDELAFIMNVYSGRWYFFSFPFDVKLKNIKHDGKWVWRYYDAEERAKGGSGWKNVDTDVLKANVGYIFQCNTAGDLELPVGNPDFFSQSLSRTRGASDYGDKSVKLMSYQAKNPEDASWNFIGNPNLSYYSLTDMANEKDFNAPITVWDPEQQTYTAVVPGDDDYDFHPFQAFFVQKPSDYDDVTFRGENRSTFNQSQKKAAARSLTRGTRVVDEKRLFVNLEISNGQMKDKTRVVFDDSKTAKYETGTDASKFLSMEAVPQIYTLDAQDVKYSVNNCPNNNHEVRLGIIAPTDGVYTIDASLMDCRMALKDMATGTIHDFSNGAYTFQTEAGTHEDRFFLVAGSFTNISENGIEGLDISATDGSIIVNGITDQPANIYKMNGVRMGTLSASGSINLGKGTYIVSVGDKASKVLVK